MHVAASSVQLHRDAAVQLQGFMVVLVGVAQLQVEKGGGVGIKHLMDGLSSFCLALQAACSRV